MARGRLRPSGPAGAIALSAWPAAASAHLVETGLGPVADGAWHLATAAEALLPVLGLAVWVGLRRADAARVAAVLLLAWSAGGLLGWRAFDDAGEWLDWLPLLAAGALAAIDPPLRPRPMAWLVAAFGAVLGARGGAELAQAQLGPVGIAGSAVAAAVMLRAAAWLAARTASGWRGVAWRVAGSWIAASGLLLLGWTLRGGALG